MKIYHTETREDYYSLMTELEGKGCEWMSGGKPTHSDYFRIHGKDTYFYEECGGISLSDGDYFKKHYKDESIIEYKSKGDKQMLNPECKHCHKKWHQDSAKYCSWCGNKLVDEPEFKYGDIVASRIFRDASFSLVRLNEDLTNRLTSVDGFWYTKDDYAIGDMSLEVFKEDTRHATPEEIAEYEVALTFHKHGRKPFEVKKDDILLEDGNYKFFVDDPENWGEEDFVSGGYTFAKTAEEVDEWIKGENE